MAESRERIPPFPVPPNIKRDSIDELIETLSSQQRRVLETAPRLGRAVKVAIFQICTGTIPESIRQLDAHVKQCERCSTEWGLHRKLLRTAVNRRGWWSGSK